MAEKEVSIKLTAKDETASAFNSVGERMKKFMEGAGGEKLVEGLVGGAAVVAALEMVAKGAEFAATFLRKYTEELERAGSAAERDQAMMDGLNEAFKEHVPILGHVVGAIEEAADAWKDYRAVQMAEEGATEEEINKERSREGFRKYALQTLEATTAAYFQQANALNDLVGAKAKEGHATAEQLEVLAAANAVLQKQFELTKQIEDYKRDHPNRTPAQNRILGMMEDAKAKEAEAGEHQVQEIHNRFRKQRADEDRDEAKRHRDDTFKNLQDTADLEAQAHAQRLRASHLNGEADLVLLRRQHEREIQESKRAEDEAIIAAQQAAAKRSKERGDPQAIQEGNEESRRIQREAEARRKMMNEKFGADEAKLKQDTANASQDEAEQRRHTLASMRLDILKEEAAMGNQAAKAAAEGLGIQEKFNAKRAELNRLLREAQNLPDEERKKLLALLPAYDALQKAELQRMKMGQVGPPTSPFSQQSEMGMGDTGMREAFAANVRSAEDRTLEQMQKMTDAIIAQAGTINDIYSTLDDINSNLTVK